jgi:hypothetical protein
MNKLHTIFIIKLLHVKFVTQSIINYKNMGTKNWYNGYRRWDAWTNMAITWPYSIIYLNLKELGH